MSGSDMRYAHGGRRPPELFSSLNFLHIDLFDYGSMYATKVCCVYRTGCLLVFCCLRGKLQVFYAMRFLISHMVTQFFRSDLTT